MHVEVPRPSGWQNDTSPLTSIEMRTQVFTAGEIQMRRYRGTPYSHNSELSGSALRKFSKLSNEAELLLKSSFETLGLSMRAFDRIIKLSRTIADLDGRELIAANHIAEAIQYRQLDRRGQELTS
ncbi:hypothetical protein [Paenibacillus segetis]|nr:hypothetical protein [Paenibacillus segetis]